MRLAVLLLLVACGASPRATTLPANQPISTTPARDLAEAKSLATKIASGDAGQLVVEIGIAPVKPAEFVIFRIAQFSGGTSLSE